MMSADYEEQDETIPHSIGVSSSFFYWQDLYPELSILIDNIDVIRREARNISMVS